MLLIPPRPTAYSLPDPNMDTPLAMVVEDDLYLADIFAQAFRKAGYALEVVHDGLTARQRLSQLAPQVVVLDVHLPEVSGAALLDQIRADPRLAGTRVIIVTGDPYLASQLESRADLALVKPVGYLQLRDLAMKLKTTNSFD